MSVATPSERLAIDGGAPVRSTLLPYGRQSIDDADVAAVVEALRSDWLTTGPRVGEFEKAFAAAVGAAEAVAVSSGTAALHAAIAALGIGPGDEVVVPAITFAASANAVVYQGGVPVFADVDPQTLLLDPAAVRSRLGPRTRAVVAVDYAGQPADYEALREVIGDLPVVADACHALGAESAGRRAGTLAELSTFSFHPVKHITTGEGGMITTADPELAGRMRVFRNHGITSDHRQREKAGSWTYEMVSLGYNYRLSDIQCALGLSQLRRLDSNLRRRREIAAVYDGAFRAMEGIRTLRVRAGISHAYHLYAVLLDLESLSVDRGTVFRALRAEGIGCNVHYPPVHLHPFYRKQFGTGPGLCPVAEAAYERLLTLPLYPGMTDEDVDTVVRACRKVLAAYRR